MPSLQSVHDMSWREFQLRKHGYYRQQKQEWYKVREIAYWSAAGTALDPKKTKINDFMPIDEVRSKQVSESTKTRFAELQKEYLKKVEANGSE